jgi:hypothetical protein
VKKEQRYGTVCECSKITKNVFTCVESGAVTFTLTPLMKLACWRFNYQSFNSLQRLASNGKWNKETSIWQWGSWLQNAQWSHLG